jgi:tetratricopeptide (TPR) repeat protein
VSEVPVVPAPPSPIAVEQALLGDILKTLRKQHDPQAALGLLEDHSQRFPGTVLAPEAAMLRAEALLGLGRNAEALSELDRLSLGSMPNRDERFVLRGELRAAAERWREAREDFEMLLSAPTASGMDAKARDMKARALWGRASARSHLGDEAGTRADLTLYLRAFPSGRFASQAAALLQGSP